MSGEDSGGGFRCSVAVASSRCVGWRSSTPSLSWYGRRSNHDPICPSGSLALLCRVTGLRPQQECVFHDLKSFVQDPSTARGATLLAVCPKKLRDFRLADPASGCLQDKINEFVIVGV